MKGTFDTSSEVTKKKAAQGINAEPEMIELKRMIRAGELDAARTIATVKGELSHEDKAEGKHEATVR
jgi:uncharacterized protein (DUF1501 family)